MSRQASVKEYGLLEIFSLPQKYPKNLGLNDVNFSPSHVDATQAFPVLRERPRSETPDRVRSRATARDAG